MIKKAFTVVAAVIVAAGFSLPCKAADTWELKIPLRSRSSPVQRLNRAGVKDVKNNQYEKAEALFYKAYLYDPSDPFTLNNLGYVAELQGQLARAHRYYQLAAEQGCDAPIDMSSLASLKGKPMGAAYAELENLPMRVNRMNVDAMRLLAEGHAFQAIALLQDALRLDPRNPFTLNNLGVASERLGDFEDALRYYGEAADLDSRESVTITQDRGWRGKSISKMARESARRLRKRMEQMPPGELAAAQYNVRGVHEMNENQPAAARRDFLRAYALDPNSAFSLNNRGYVAEMNGDLETAQFFYAKAWTAGGARARVGSATSSLAHGEAFPAVAAGNNAKIGQALAKYTREQRGQPGPIQLTPRHGAQISPPARNQPASERNAPALTPR